MLAGSSPAQVTARVSVDSSGAQGNAESLQSVLSADGRFVVLTSVASNLVAGDTNGKLDIFVRDRLLGITERVSVGPGGAQSNGDSYASWVTPGGRYVAFESFASNLVAGDTNDSMDVFVRDRLLGTTERASVGSAGLQADDHSLALQSPTVSPDGRYVVFGTYATNLVATDANGAVIDVYVRDRQSDTTELVSVDSAGAQVGFDCFFPSISADGRYVAFYSLSPDLVAGDTNAMDDVFVHDRQGGATERVSVDSSGAQGSGNSSYPWISADGRFVAFHSSSADLVGNDTNGALDVFVRDRLLGRTERVSVDSYGVQADDDSLDAALSSDGRFVAFWSAATDLVLGDANALADVFVRDRLLGTTDRVSVDSSAAEANSTSTDPSVSDDGRFVEFDSFATNLVAVDTNGSRDVFVRDRDSPGFTSLCEPGQDGVRPCPCSNPQNGEGRGCDNSSATGGAYLLATGAAYLASDSLVFTTSGERPRATSVLVQGTALVAGGAIYGQGVRCVGGTLKRLYTRSASTGGITVPDFAAGDPPVSARSATLGDAIQAGENRFYLVFYRDATVLGGCPAASTFNATQSGAVAWSP